MDSLPTTTFKSGWSRLERVLFLLTLLLIICVLTLSSGIVLILFGDIKIPSRRTNNNTTTMMRMTMTTPTSVTRNVSSSTMEASVALSTNPIDFTSSEVKDQEKTSVMVTSTTKQPKTTTIKTTTRLQPMETKVCESRGCVVAAARILQTMNSSVDACEDFYNYACGSWMESHPVKDEGSDSVFRDDIKDKTEKLLDLLSSSPEPEEIEAVRKTKITYTSCISQDYINQKSISNVAYLINAAGGMPLVDQNWTMEQSLEDFLIRLRKNFGVMPLIPVTVMMDEQNNYRNLIHIGSGQQVSNDDIVSPKPYGAHLTDPLYDQLASQILKQFKVSRKLVDKQIQEIGIFQKKLGIVKWQTKMNSGDFLEYYHNTTLKELQTNYTNFNWKYFLEGLLRMNGSEVVLPEDEVIIMFSLSYIERLMELMNNTRNTTIVNYAILSTIMYYKDPLGIESRSLYSETINKKISNVRYDHDQDRSLSCVDVFVENFKHVLGWMYIHKYFRKEQEISINKIIEMTKFLKESVKSVLEKTTWLGEKSKKNSLAKIRNLLEIIGYNNKTMTAENVNRLFNGLHISRWNYFRNVIQIKARQVELQLSILGVPTSRSGFDGDGMFAVNAWYDSQVNVITIPAGVISNPFFSMESPMALNFGSLGTIVGHELMHAYDDEGSLYDSKGNFFPWFSTEDKKKFNQFTQGLIKQYSDFEIPNTDLTVNGKLTLGENIADNGGIKVTYKGYLKWKKTNQVADYRLPGLNLNPKQLFFLSFAQNWCSTSSLAAYRNQIRYDPHAPNVARVILALRNSKDFSSVYGCPIGSKMNPATKYGVW